MALSPRYYADKSRQWRERHKAAGRCSRCGLRREAGRKSVCAECVRIMSIKLGHINNGCDGASTSAA